MKKIQFVKSPKISPFILTKAHLEYYDLQTAHVLYEPMSPFVLYRNRKLCSSSCAGHEALLYEVIYMIPRRHLSVLGRYIATLYVKRLHDD